MLLGVGAVSVAAAVGAIAPPLDDDDDVKVDVMPS